MHTKITQEGVKRPHPRTAPSTMNGNAQLDFIQESCQQRANNWLANHIAKGLAHLWYQGLTLTEVWFPRGSQQKKKRTEDTDKREEGKTRVSTIPSDCDGLNLVRIANSSLKGKNTSVRTRSKIHFNMSPFHNSPLSFTIQSLYTAKE